MSILNYVDAGLTPVSTDYQSYRLPKQKIKSLVGTNHIWSTTGEVSVTRNGQTLTGGIVSFEGDGTDIEVTSKITPVQDLHGLPYPYPEGGYKNKYSVLIGDDSWSNNASGSHSNTDGTLNVTFANAGNSGSYADNGSKLRQFGASATGTYTWSCDIKADAAVSINIGFENLQVNAVNVTTSWQRISGTVTFDATSRAFIIYNRASATGTVHLKDFQLESGSSPTSYAPYSNYCPIQGWTGTDISVCGLNLADESAIKRTDFNGSANNNWIHFDQLIKCENGQQFSFTSDFGLTTVYSLQAKIFDEHKNHIGYMTPIYYVNPTSVKFTINFTGAKYAEIGFYHSQSLASYTMTNPMLVYGNDYKPYEAYNGATYPVEWHYQTGKNMFDGDYVVGYLSSGITWKTDVAATRTAVIPITGGQTYTCTKSGGTRFIISEAPTLPVENTNYTQLFNNSAATTATVTPSSSAKYLLVYVTNDGTEPTLQVEKGSSSTPYEAYGTVYEGEVEVTGGLLKVTHKDKDLGDLTWTMSVTGVFTTDVGDAPTGVTGGVDAICSAYKRFTTGTWASSDFVFALNYAGIYSSRLQIRDSNFSDAASFTTAVTGQQLIYEIAPITAYTANLLPTPTKDGYTFEGWFTSLDYTTPIEVGDAIPSGEVLLFAKWHDDTNSIEYLAYEWGNSDLASGSCHLSNGLVSQTLDTDTFTFTVFCDDPTIEDYEYGTEVTWTHNSVVRKFYLASIERVGVNSYKFDCVSAVGLLAFIPHVGGMYTGVLASDIIDDIMSDTSVVYTIAADVGATRLTGWLPYSNKRDNLQMTLLALGASVIKDASGSVEIVFSQPQTGTNLPSSVLYMGGKFSSPSHASKVSVTEHLFTQSGTQETLYTHEGVDADNLLIKWDAPVYNVTFDNTFTVHESGANYCIVSGYGSIYGYKYEHQTTVKTLEDEDYQGTTNEVSVSDCTLISALNSNAVLHRLYDYYTKAEEITTGVDISTDQFVPGEPVRLISPYGDETTGYVKEMDITLSKTLKSDTKIITNWQPSNVGNTYDAVAVISSSGTWTPPVDYQPGTQAMVVLLGGATGGQDGENGANGEDTGELIASENTYTRYAKGKGGAGGKGGEGGKGVMVYTFELSSLSGSYSVVIGTGGTHGIGTATTWDDKSSSDGNLNTIGLINLVTGLYYCLPGADGTDGADGGDGGSVEGGWTEWTLANALNGGSVGETLGGLAGTKGAPDYSNNRFRRNRSGAGGGGGASYLAQGGDAGESAWTVAGNGGNGSSPSALPQASNGQCGNGGHGGGGGGGAGGKQFWSSDSSGSKGFGGNGGTGATGQQGGNGLVFVYYQSTADTVYPQISVTTEAGATITLSDGQTYTLGVGETTHVFDVALGSYDVTAGNGIKSKTETVLVDAITTFLITIDFSVLPQGYTEVNYIQGTGTQYIDTGIIPNTSYIKTSSVAQLITTSYSGVRMMLGCVDMVGRWYVAYDSSQANKLSIGWGGGSAYAFVNITIDTDWHEYIIETQSNNAGVIVTLDGTQFYTSATTGTRPAKSIKLMAYDASNNVVTPAPMKMSSFKAYGGSSDKPLIADMYPCIRESDNAVGMYDIVRNQFYGNAGTGTFLYE